MLWISIRPCTPEFAGGKVWIRQIFKSSRRHHHPPRISRFHLLEYDSSNSFAVFPKESPIPTLPPLYHSKKPYYPSHHITLHIFHFVDLTSHPSTPQSKYIPLSNRLLSSHLLSSPLLNKKKHLDPKFRSFRSLRRSGET